MQVVTYTPHGALPDRRGFAPAIVASEIARRLSFTSNIHVTAREDDLSSQEIHPTLGEIHRIHESFLYTRFRKLTSWNPIPLHARLAQFCQFRHPQIVHAHQVEFPAEDFRSRLNFPTHIVIHAHSVRTWQPSLGVADQYIAVSEFTRDQMIERGFPAERICVIPNGADTELFCPSDPTTREGLRIALDIPPDCFVLAYVGRKQASKGFVTFLQTLQILNNKGLKIKGVCAGPTPTDTAREEGYAKREKLRLELIQEGLLVDLPALPHHQLVHVYRLADSLLFATQFKGEQHPLVLIEALSCGCVVLTTRLAGITETVRHQEHAILLENPSDAQEAAQHLMEIAAFPERFDAMRTAGRELARRKYDWRIIAGQVERLYFSLT